MILKRTFVVTTMFRHMSDNLYISDPYVPTSLRLDLKQIHATFNERYPALSGPDANGRQFKIKIQDAETALANCNYTFDAAMYLKKRSDIKIRKMFEKFYQVNLPAPQHKFLEDMFTDKYLQITNDQDIVKYFDANGPYNSFKDVQKNHGGMTDINYRDKRCALFLMPLNSIQTSDRLYSYRVLKFPEYVFQILKEFYKFMDMGSIGRYDLGIHWRYNYNDWGKRCRGIIKDKDALQCELINRDGGLTPMMLADLIRTWYLSYDEDASDRKKRIYIAAPESEVEFINTARDILEGKNIYERDYYMLYKVKGPVTKRSVGSEEMMDREKIDEMFDDPSQIDPRKTLDTSRFKDINVQVDSMISFKPFFTQNWPICKTMVSYKNEIESLLEQAILERSDQFYYWPVSTWSERIQLLRKFFILDQHPEYLEKFGEGKDGVLADQFSNNFDIVVMILKMVGHEFRSGEEILKDIGED